MTCTTHHHACECIQDVQEGEINRLKKEVEALTRLARLALGLSFFILDRSPSLIEKRIQEIDRYNEMMGKNNCDRAKKINNIDLTPYLESGLIKYDN